MGMPAHSVIRLRLIWLTLVSLLLAAAMYELRPDNSIVARFPFSRDAADARSLLQYPDTPGHLNMLRANFVLDMGFLLAYGFLLRETARSRKCLNRILAKIEWVNVMSERAAFLCIPLMAADAVENLAGLSVLGLLPVPLQGYTWLFYLAPVASTVKWSLAGVVMLLLGMLWWSDLRRKRFRHHIGRLTSLLFVTGGAASLAVAVCLWLRSARGVAVAGGIALYSPAAALVLQIILWRSIGLAAKLLYAVRVPVFSLLFLAVFGPIALGPAKPLLRAILYFGADGLGRWWYLPMVSAAAFITAFACIAQIALVLLYGGARTEDPALRRLYDERVLVLVRWSSIAAATLLVASAATGSYVPVFVRTGNWLLLLQAVVSIALGFGVALSMLIVAEMVQARLSKPGAPLPKLMFRTDRWPGLRARFAAVQKTPAPKVSVAVLARLSRIFAGTGRGYWNRNGEILPGHIFALSLAALSTIFYIFVLIFKVPGQGSGTFDTPNIPTLAAIVLLVLTAGWVLAGLAFFLDRYRVPLLTAVLVIWFGLAGSLENTDHVFRLEAEKPAEAYRLRTPNEVLASYDDPVLIAAAGGGIQAAAWTTRVLEGINKEWRGNLRDRVALLSTVSGGSVGALFFGAYLDGDLQSASKMARVSSLDEVAWVSWARTSLALFCP